MTTHKDINITEDNHKRLHNPFLVTFFQNNFKFQTQMIILLFANSFSYTISSLLFWLTSNSKNKRKVSANHVTMKTKINLLNH